MRYIWSVCLFLVSAYTISSFFLFSMERCVEVHRAGPENPHEKTRTTKNNVDMKLLRTIDHHLHDMTPPISEHETIFSSFTGALIRESQASIIEIIPEGSFLDAGCQFGEQAAHYAIAAPNREIIAVDPSSSNVGRVMNEYGALNNLVVKQGGLGREVGTMVVPDESFNMPVGTKFPIFTLDSLFHDQHKKLGFAHLDLEGLELDVLKGGVKTIENSRPLFTTELRVHKDVEYTTNLLEFISDLEYDSYVINEVCGYPHMDYRNLLNIPKEKSKLMQYSDTFTLLDATKSLTRIPMKSEGQKTVFDLVLPCCALGEACCPTSDINAKECCSEKSLMKWLDEHKLEINPYMYSWKAARNEFHRYRYRLGQRQKYSQKQQKAQ